VVHRVVFPKQAIGRIRVLDHLGGEQVDAVERLGHAVRAVARSSTPTLPVPPFTRIRSPVRMLRVPVRVLTTHGTPSSRAQTAAWLIAPPMSTTSAELTNMIEAQPGSVNGETRISPSSTSP